MIVLKLVFSFQEVCFVAETCTPGLTLHAMASEMEFAGIEQGEILRDQVQNLGEVLEGQLNNNRNYIERMGDFTSRFCLLRCGKTFRNHLQLLF